MYLINRTMKIIFNYFKKFIDYLFRVIYILEYIKYLKVTLSWDMKFLNLYFVYYVFILFHRDVI
jgi:hypothetical protein